MTIVVLFRTVEVGAVQVLGTSGWIAEYVVQKSPAQDAYEGDFMEIFRIGVLGNSTSIIVIAQGR